MTKFIVIEGIDGTGKKTQYDLLIKYIKNALNKPVLELVFPQYGKQSATYVERYLNGTYGSNVHPDLASMLYAFDRWQSKEKVDEFSSKNPDGYIIANRYIVSTLAHQGGKITTSDERKRFYNEQLDLEFNQFGIKKPDMNYVMLLPEEIAQKNVDNKQKREYTDKKRDIHEADLDHLKNAANAYREVCQLYPQFTTTVDCWDINTKSMRSIEDIHQQLVKLI